jgi:putative flavoprotein involved in K+ transport
MMIVEGRVAVKHRPMDTVVIGGGQAGLAAGYYLQRQGWDFVILDAHRRVGDSWHRRWDSLRLFTPASLNGLPGMPFPAPRGHYPTKDEMADYLEAYVARFALPVQPGVQVDALSREGDGYVIDTAAGRWDARQVVVATGAYAAPRVPDFALQLDQSISQMHSVDYRNPGQLRDGPVLIVGAGNSGAEIALDVARLTRHPVWLAGRNPGHIPSGYVSGRRSHLIASLVVGLALRLPVDTWPGRWMVRKARAFMGGHPVVRVQPGDLQGVGVQRVPRVAGVRDGQPLLADGRTLEVANVLWCTGFVRDTLRGWIRLPIFDENGVPRHHRGVVQSEPGLYFLGLPFQSSVLSGIVASAGPDARYVAGQIAKRARATIPAYQVGRQPV